MVLLFPSLLGIILKKFRIMFIGVLVFVAGFFWSTVYARWITHWNLARENEGKPMVVTGYVSSLPRPWDGGVSFEFDTETMENRHLNTKIKLSCYDREMQDKVFIGDKWKLTVKLRRPHGTLNPGGFDGEKHMLVRHIRATGYVIVGATNVLLASSWCSYPIGRLRAYLINRITKILPQNNLAAPIVAMVLGFEDTIDQETWRILRETGTSYLVAISGLHIGLVASLVLVLIQFLWRCSSILPLIIPAREAGVLGGLGLSLVYAAISGLSIPTKRALVIVVIFSIRTFLRQRNSSWEAWLWSLFIVLLLNPMAPLTIGFWLSFVAVAAIIYVTSNRQGVRAGWIANFGHMQFTVTLVLLPFTLLFFQQFSLVTMVANAIAMPAVCFAVIPLALFGTLLLLFSENLGALLLLLASKIFSLAWHWLSFLANNFNCSWYHPIYNRYVLIATILGIILLLAPRGFPARYLGLFGLVPLFFYIPPIPSNDGEVWFTLLDVGQGLAAVVQTRNHLLLYDTGLKLPSGDSGSRVIIPYLRQMGIGKIDTMVVSHGDSDHSGGVSSILQAMPVTRIVTSDPGAILPHPSQHCMAGQKWRWDGVDFTMLAPQEGYELEGNNASCVLKITTGDNSILLTGDIERRTEKNLVKTQGDKLGSTILIAPHHGSATSSTKDFIESVVPKYVLFPVGYRNRFRFPAKKIMARYLATGADTLNVSEAGAITFKFDTKSAILYPEKYRSKAKRFWHDG